MAVAPLAGAWIEIRETIMYYVQVGVAPLAGAWIEIVLHNGGMVPVFVAPLAGAWIEITWNKVYKYEFVSRPPRGGVD